MPRCAVNAYNTESVDLRSTTDYCETPDSSMRQYEELDCSNRRHLCRGPSIQRYMKKHYKFPHNTCYYQPRVTLSTPNRRIHSRPTVRKRINHVEETTSMDDRKSLTSYSSLLTVDVTREMDAVNKDIEEIIRRCDDFPTEINSGCRGCCHYHRKQAKVARCGLTQEQIKILTLTRPPLDKLKDIPPGFLKPRQPKNVLKEKSLSAPHTKYKTSRDIRDIVEETDALLRSVYKELSRKGQGARNADDETCQCEGPRGMTDPKPASCLERYLGLQNKCRRIHENRWGNPRWKHIFERDGAPKLVIGKPKHFHDTNCISEPTTSSCLLKNKKEDETKASTTYKETGVNTESDDILIRNQQEIKKNMKSTSDTLSDCPTITPKTFNDRNSTSSTNKKLSIDLQPLKYFVSNNCSDETSKPTPCNNMEYEWKSSQSGEQLSKTKEKNDEDDSEKQFSTSLLLNRNIGLTLDTSPKIKMSDHQCDHQIQPVTDDYVTQYDHLYGKKSSGAGDSLSTSETTKIVISQILNKIVNMPRDWPSANIKMVENMSPDIYEKSVDSSIFLEIMRRIVDLMHVNYQTTETVGEMPPHFARVRQMKQDHLNNIRTEIRYILDLDYYLSNASHSRTERRDNI